MREVSGSAGQHGVGERAGVTEAPCLLDHVVGVLLGEFVGPLRLLGGTLHQANVARGAGGGRLSSMMLLLMCLQPGREKFAEAVSESLLVGENPDRQTSFL